MLENEGYRNVEAYRKQAEKTNANKKSAVAHALAIGAEIAQMIKNRIGQVGEKAGAEKTSELMTPNQDISKNGKDLNETVTKTETAVNEENTSGNSDLHEESEHGKIEDVAVASAIFVNKSDRLFENAKKVTPIEGYEDIVSHADPGAFYAYTSDGNTEYTYSPEEFANMIRQSPNYHGGNIRLLACSSGVGANSVAQQLADELGVDVLAPNDFVWIYSDGEMFVASSPTKRDGKWIIMKPRRK